ncbi:MAG: molybdenum cofactor guanylyltransferase [Candidatus Sabulitectum sp.]|nr:molybdenum cofactor guanylyltransferase [Candidatus Sabulitectum sp.]
MTGVCGVVLAGGRSSRMGRDKRAVILPGGLSMEQNALRILNLSNCGGVFTSGPGGIADIHSGRGPMGGIEASLYALNCNCVAFLPCDMPYVMPYQVDRVISCFLRSPDLPAVAMAPFMEPLFSVVPVSWGEMISNAVAQRHLKVGKFWQDCGFTPVRIPEGYLLKDADHFWEVPA